MTPILTRRGIAAPWNLYYALVVMALGFLPVAILSLLWIGISMRSTPVVWHGIGAYWLIYMPFCLIAMVAKDGPMAHWIYELLAIILPIGLVGLGVYGGQELLTIAGMAGLFVMIAFQSLGSTF